jgi:hypothetical protein
MVTPETLKPMNLLVETGIVSDHVVDGGLVDEHVVDGLVDDHEVVADRQEVVADRQESLGKRSKIPFLFVIGKMCVHAGLVYRRRERWSLCGLPTLS